MKSKANFLGHPIHPLLIPFPVAFFTGTVVLDILWLFSGNVFYSQAALYAQSGGLFFALLAAVPGSIDYFFTVPPESSAKKRATRHALINLTVVFLFGIVLLLKLKSQVMAGILISVEAIAFGLLLIGGWLGGTLVTRNQIGVDHRYAEAGKWQEESIDYSGETFAISRLGNLKKDQMKLLHVKGKRIAVGQTGSAYAVFDDRCTHRGGSLADGVLMCGTVQCPWHGSQFDVNTGDVKAGPAKEKIKIWNIINQNGGVLLTPERKNESTQQVEKTIYKNEANT